MSESDDPAIETYDAIIIGSGQAGGPLSTALVAAGKRTALIEREHIGGTCINEGCTPTKTMVASARVAYLAGRGSEYGVEIDGHTTDMVKVRQRKRDIVESFRSGSEGSIRRGGVDIITGEASFVAPKTVEVSLTMGGSRRVRADLIVIDTGTRPADPPLPGLSGVPHLDSTSIMELAAVPEHLLILGGGYIGVEFGQMFRRFGSNVTIVERASQLLEREDTDIADGLREIFEQDGIEIVLGAVAQKVEAAGAGIQLSVTVDGEERIFTGSHLLVAAGRKPNVEALDLDAAGVKLGEHGVILVDDRLETSAPGIYAVGEVAGTPAFTHMSYDDFRILRTNLIEGGNRSTTGRLLPYAVFTDPQLGRVGLSEKEARRNGQTYHLATMPMSHVARALEMDESRGMVKALVDPETEQVLGAAVLGIEGGEIMAMFQLAMMGHVPYSQLRDGIFAHPTLAELLNTLFTDVAPPGESGA